MAAIQTSQTQFGANEQITSAKLNNILLQSSFADGAVTGDGTITISTGRQLQVGTLKTANYPASGITEAKIADGAVAPAKLSSGGPSWSSSSSTFGSGVTGSYTVNITPSRTGDGSTTINIGSQTSVSTSATIARGSGVDGTLDFTQTGAGAMTFTSATGGFKFGTAPMPTPVGSAPIFGVRAWVTFDMNRNSSGGVDSLNTARYLYASGNVSTVVKNATGDFTVNFTTVMPDTYYTYAGSGLDDDTTGDIAIGRPSGGAKTVNGIRLKVINTNGAGVNKDEVVVSFIR